MRIQMLPYSETPGTTGGGGSATGTSVNSQPPSTGARSSGNVTSGTASEAMIKAATAASSAAPAPAGTPGAPGTPTPPATGTGSPEATAGATAQPQGQGQQPGQGQPQGQAPENRIQAAVTNARNKMLSQLGLQPNTNPQHVKAAMNLLQRLSTAEGARSFWQELGQRLGSQPGQAEEADEALPQPDLVSQDGKLKTYSDATLQKFAEVRERNLMRRLMGELRPMMDFMQDTRSSQQQAAAKASQQQMVGQALNHARTLPHFKENEKAIAAKLSQMNPQYRQQVGIVAALHMCYNTVMAESVLPGMQTAAEAKVREEYAKKANAAAGHVGTQTVGTEGKKVELKDAQQLARHMERMASAATASQ